MAEHTNSTAEDPFAGNDVASMEDILASIRSMIADDEPAAAAVSAPPPVAEVIAEARNAPETPALPVETPVDLAEDIASSLDMDLVADAPESTSRPVSTPMAVEAEAIGPSVASDFDIDSLFDPIELEPVEIESVDIAPTAVPQSVAPSPETPMALAGAEDMDLVKSLMDELSEPGDLTVEPDSAPVSEVDALELSDEWFAEDLSIPDMPKTETVASTAEPPPKPPIETVSERDLMDEILNQTLEDEIALSEPDVPADDEVAEPVATANSPVVEAAANIVSLSEIAARAEKDADELQSRAPVVDGTDPQTDVDTGKAIETELADADAPVAAPENTDTELAQALEEEVMARTAPLEEIVNDDVETEATNAFAELNRLVEEKNTFEERGPRIGDLVQEALKPMLKDWLDENLKGIVERAVQKEVKRIASGK